MEKRWNIQKADPQKQAALQQSLKVNAAICGILTQRGIETFEEAKSFFRPSLSDLHDPWLMKDMALAVKRITTAIDGGEKTLIFGDYDVDGTTAVASLFQFLKKRHSAIEFYIPHRYREGYGVSRAGIDYAKDNNFTLIISLDCGIKSVELIRYAREIGIDFVVCDHHLPDAELPPAFAILNAKQPDCNYPYKELCGCGVAFKLMTALAQTWQMDMGEVHECLDLLATAIAADIVPMTGENRIMAFHGMKKANENPNNGIRALAQLSGLKKELLINNLVFMIAPRVNAAGRMDDARKAVQMFIAETPEEALHFAEMLHSDNTDRKETDSTITVEALSMIRGSDDWETRRSTLLFQPHWHKGVVGIVASRLIEHYHRPTIVLTQSGELVAGSARSVPGFNLYEAIHACREHLLAYGGHFAAAGLTLEMQNVDALRSKFEEVVSSTIHPDMLIPEILIDAEISFKDIKQPFYDIICQMEPFGPGNCQPNFIARNVTDTGFSKIVKDQHIRFSLRQGDALITGIGFGMAEKYPLLMNRKPLDIVFKIDENEWNGERNLQIRVVDLRIAAGS